MICSSSAFATPTSELKTFGLWFTSGKFESKWASAQLMEVLKLSKDVNDDRNVLCYLEKIAPSIPREAIKCLGLIADGSRAKWLISGKQESSRAILSTSLQSGDEETRKAAIELINRLLARNYADFRNLLPNGVA